MDEIPGRIVNFCRIMVHVHTRTLYNLSGGPFEFCPPSAASNNRVHSHTRVAGNCPDGLRTGIAYLQPCIQRWQKRCCLPRGYSRICYALAMLCLCRSPCGKRAVLFHSRPAGPRVAVRHKRTKKEPLVVMNQFAPRGSRSSPPPNLALPVTTTTPSLSL